MRSQHHPQHSLRLQYWGLWSGRNHQHRGHVAEIIATLGRAYLPNGGGHRLPKIALYGKLSTGYRDRGAPKKRFKDSLKKTLGTCYIDHYQWSTFANDRRAWRYAVYQVVFTFEDSRRANLWEKRRRRMIQGALTAIPDQTFDCSHCSRTCLSRIGLVSHQHACSRRKPTPS